MRLPDSQASWDGMRNAYERVIICGFEHYRRHGNRPGWRSFVVVDLDRHCQRERKPDIGLACGAGFVISVLVLAGRVPRITAVLVLGP